MAETRAADTAAQQNVSEATLIQRAAGAVAREALLAVPRVYGSRCVVVAGKGHNGADALWAGVRLGERGMRVDVVLPMGEPADVHGAAPLAQLRRAGARIVDGADAGTLLERADLVVDGLVGVGSRPGATLPWQGMRDALGGARVVAVDVPSGVDADTGAAAEDAVRADVTVTFGSIKVGLVVGEGKRLAGQVVVADIGLWPREGWTTFPTAMLDADDVARLVAVPDPAASKYSRGVVGIVAGSSDYPGAAVLACAGALAGGAGMVRLFAPGEVQDLVRSRHPEVVAHDLPTTLDGLPRVDRWVVGSGLGRGDAAADVVRLVLGDDRPLVLDADALHHATAAGIRGRSAPVLITPHAGELSRLMAVDAADIAADPLGVARRVASDLGVILLLKGDATVVADAGGSARINPTGTSWLASAGTGDVLAGLAGAVWAGDLDSAAVAPWLHGLAGRLAAGAPGAPLTASDVAARVPAALRLARGGAG